MTLARAKGPRGRADRAFSKIIRARGACERCGRSGQAVFLQCAHIVSRRFSATRTDVTNALCLCAKCHRFFTDNPVEWTLWLESYIGLAEYLRLKDKAQASGKFGKAFWEAEAKRLEGLVKKMEAA